MCVAFLLLAAHPELRFLLAFNRDEYLERPTKPAYWWPGQPEILASKDLQGGGTWLGLTRAGRFALLTNVREVDYNKVKDAASRGGLPVAFLTSLQSPVDFLSSIKKQEYNGFNMVVGNLRTMEVAYMTNRGESQQPVPLQPGLHGISNGSSLQHEWVKVQRGKSILQDILGLQTQSASDPQLPHPANTAIPSSYAHAHSDSNAKAAAEDKDKLHPASAPDAQQQDMQGSPAATREAGLHGHLQTASLLPSGHRIGNVMMSSGVQPSAEEDQSGCLQQASEQSSSPGPSDTPSSEAPAGLPTAAHGSQPSSSPSQHHALPWNDILTHLMQDSIAISDDSQLPQTGMPEQLERNLSPIFISQHAMPNGAYGTRTQTVIAAWQDDHVAMRESNLMPDGSWVQNCHGFALAEA